MIKITGENGTSLEFIGTIAPVPEKRKTTLFDADNGTERTSYVRAVINYSITIPYLTQEEYDILEFIYFKENDVITVQDTNININQNKMYITNDGFSLTSTQSREDGKLYWSGTLSLRRR